MKTLFLLLLAFTFTNAQVEMKNTVVMPAIFSDNMVLQRETIAPIWGKATPGTEVKITSTWGKTANAVAADDGNWMGKIETPKAGGPYKLKLEIGDSTIVYKNVLIGEVWLCSGQSNMEMPMEGWPPQSTVNGSAEEIKNADYPNIRLFTVVRSYSTKPKFNCIGTWSECSPQTAAQFSATAFFFGKKLYKELNVPIGLIHSSWGGTPVESWTSAKYLSEMAKYKDIYADLDKANSEHQKLKAWLSNFPVIDLSGKDADTRWEGLNFNDSGCSSVNYDDSSWKEMNLPTLWEAAAIGTFDGVVWFRKKINIPASWLNKDLVLDLGPIDDMDITFVNGEKVGGYEKTGFYDTFRSYKIPKELVTNTTLTIAVRVVDNQGGGGIWGKKDDMKIHPAEGNGVVSLAGSWKYLPVAEYTPEKFYVFGAENDEYDNRPKLSIDISAFTPTALFNGMIAPLIPYSIKGVIWYQGEANTGNPEEYKTLFPLMIKNWRTDWKIGDFPFYYVQIAPYNYGNNTNSQRLREAQLLTLSVPNTGMAVTLDIGNANNIHPGDKKDVGERLALWALAKNYNRDVAYSGPIYKSMKVESNKIELSFDYAEGLTIKPINGKNNFQIAGKDGNFVDADVEVKWQNLIVSSPKVKVPVSVRYAWSDTSEATLFNKYKLPASSFRTDDWKK